METIRSKMPIAISGCSLVVAQERAKLQLRGGEVLILNDEGRVLATHRLLDIPHIVVYGNVSITTPLLHECSKRGISISFLDGHGWLKGRFSVPTNKNVLHRVEQFRMALDEKSCLRIAKNIVQSKVYNTWMMIRRKELGTEENRGTFRKIYRDIAMAESLDEVRGLEGYMAATYFSLFSQFLTERSREVFSFPCRTRRPPTDPVNAMLSFGYSCLLREVMLSIGYVGLDPYVGFLHSVQAGRPSLALDMMEEFRSVLVDSLVVRLINKGEVSREDFSFAEDRCLLGISGKKIFLRAWEKKLQTKVFHPAVDCQISYRQVLEVQVRQLVHVLTQTTETYVGYRHR